MPLLQTFRRIVRSPPKAWLLVLPLLLVGCAYDGYGPAYHYRPDPYFDSCLDCRLGYGPDWGYWHHRPYGHGPGWHGPSGHDGGGHSPGHGGR